MRHALGRSLSSLSFPSSQLTKFVHEQSFDSLAEALHVHETALRRNKFLKGFFTRDTRTLEVVKEILHGNPDEQFLTDLFLSPPNLSTNEQRSRVITFSSLQNFPQHHKEYAQRKEQTALASVGGPAALDTALLASLIARDRLTANVYISGPFKESNLAHSALQLHVRHGTALNAESDLTGHALLLPFLRRHFFGCSLDEILHPDFRKIDLKLSSLTSEELRIYLGNEFNWLKQILRHRLGLMTEHDLNRLESAFSQDVLHLIENITGVPLSSNAGRDPRASISIHVDLTEVGRKETHANNVLIKKTVGIESESLTDDEKDFFFGVQKTNIVHATRYPNDGSLLPSAHCLKQKMLADRGGQCLQQHITDVLFAEDEHHPGRARLAGLITEDGQFLYGSHLHLSPGYKAKFQFGQDEHHWLNRLKNRLRVSPPVRAHRLTVATGVSVNALMRNTPHLHKIIDKFGTTPQFAVTNSHWTLLAKNDKHILMRITGGGNTGEEDYNPAYFLNLLANTERIFGRDALLGIVSTFGCPRSINARNATEFFKAANVLISYGKGGTGNTKRHGEAVLALLELGFTDDIRHLFHRHAHLATTATDLHRLARSMNFIEEDNEHFNRRLGFDTKIFRSEPFGVLLVVLGVALATYGLVFVENDSWDGLSKH